MRIAVVDDEKLFRDRICELIFEHYNSLDVVCTQFCDGTEFISAFQGGTNFDAVFLDIEMPALDGMKTAEKIREFSEDLPIVFLTSHTERAMDGYEVNAFRFLSKDADNSKVAKTLEALEKRILKSRKIIIKSNSEDYVLDPADILFVESSNNTVYFVTKNNKYNVRMKISSVLNMLNESMPAFCKIHRCIIINLSHVCGYTEKSVSLDNGENFPVSKSCSAEFKKSMLDYIKHSAR